MSLSLIATIFKPLGFRFSFEMNNPMQSIKIHSLQGMSNAFLAFKNKIVPDSPKSLKDYNCLETKPVKLRTSGEIFLRYRNYAYFYIL